MYGGTFLPVNRSSFLESKQAVLIDACEIVGLGAYLLVTSGCIMVLSSQEPDKLFELSYGGPLGLPIVVKSDKVTKLQ